MRCAKVEWIASLDTNGPGNNLRDALWGAYQAIERHETELFARLHAGLSEIGGVRIYGPAADGQRTPTAGFTIEGVSPDEAARRLAADGVCVWNGDFYATTVCDALGLSDCGGLIRAGVAPYTTSDDVERLIAGVRTLASG